MGFLLLCKFAYFTPRRTAQPTPPHHSEIPHTTLQLRCTALRDTHGIAALWTMFSYCRNATETLDVGYHVAKAQYLMEKQLQKEKMVEGVRVCSRRGVSV